MTSVAGLDSNRDWQFGRHRATYLTNSDAIRQNVFTRLRSFKNDWFLDIEHGGDWLSIFGTRNNQQQLSREIERLVLETEGVRTLNKLETVQNTERSVIIRLEYTDIFNLVQPLELPLVP